MNPADKIIPFGKYKGQPIEVLQNDSQYLSWLQAQDWFKERYQSINTLIINNFQEPSETPEHNRIQVKFLDKEFCQRFINHCSLIRNWRQTCRKLWYDNGILVKDENVKIPYLFNHVAFEECSVDVQLCLTYTVYIESFTQEKNWAKGSFPKRIPETYKDSTGRNYMNIEIKPTVSDEYPAIIRQMRSNNSTYLLTESYTGKGANIDQVKEMFKISGFIFILLNEIK